MASPSPERLSDARIQAFLATREVVILGMVTPAGAPLVTAMWFLHDPDALTMISVADLAKVPAIQRNPRVVVLAETGTRDADIRSVTVHGRATFLPDTPERRALADRFIAKYDPHLEKYWGGRVMPANRVMYRIVPERIRSLGL